jgi:hypothetical protein
MTGLSIAGAVGTQSRSTPRACGVSAAAVGRGKR